MVAAKPAEDGKPRRLVRAKSNIGPDDGGFEYELSQAPLPAHPLVYGQRVTFGAALEGNARDLLAEIEAQDGGAEAPARDATEGWLRQVLTPWPVPQADIEKRAEADGIKLRTLERAKKALGVVSAKSGLGGGWVWSLPKGANYAEGAEGGHTNRWPPSGEDGPLRGTGTDGEVF